MFFGDKRRQEVSEDEIRTMVSDNEELDDEEKRMIHEVMDLGDATAEEVMTPRVDMIMVGSDETVRQAIDRMRGTGYSRLPVFRDDDDDIIGIVRYKDLIDPLLEDKEDDLAADYVAEVGFVPESKSLLPLLNEMQTNRQQMVIVVDEYGGTAGFIHLPVHNEMLLRHCFRGGSQQRPGIVLLSPASIRRPQILIQCQRVLCKRLQAFQSNIEACPLIVPCTGTDFALPF